jgi:hypothetical protein
MKWKLSENFFRLIPNINELKASPNFVLHPSHFTPKKPGTKNVVAVSK